MKNALIIGSAGQDGTYLTRQLIDRGFRVVGVDRGGVKSAPAPIDLPPSVSVTKPEEIRGLIDTVRPEWCFYLAAAHSSAEGHDESDRLKLFQVSFDVNTTGWLSTLEAIRACCPQSRAFYASSSHVFGAAESDVQSEATPMRPTTAYAISKAASMGIARHYRQLGLHVSTGILYNHESPLRPQGFVSQRIAQGAVAALRAQRAGVNFMLELGSTSAVVDWGYAPDYTEAMIRVVSYDEPDDYVVATGERHTVADFCEVAFAECGLDWRQFIIERPARVSRPHGTLVGDATRLRTRTGWKPSISFNKLVQLLVSAARDQASPS